MKQRIYKFGTGDPIPEGAVYLSTVVQETRAPAGALSEVVTRYVWHYFLVEVEE